MRTSGKDRAIQFAALTVALLVIVLGHEYLPTNQRLLIGGACLAILAAIIGAAAIIRRRRGAATTHGRREGEVK